MKVDLQEAQVCMNVLLGLAQQTIRWLDTCPGPDFEVEETVHASFSPRIEWDGLNCLLPGAPTQEQIRLLKQTAAAAIVLTRTIGIGKRS